MKILTIIGIVIIALLLALNAYMTFRIEDMLDQYQNETRNKKSLPCESVPIEWAINHYECANSLLLAMNVTNLKFKP